MTLAELLLALLFTSVAVLAVVGVQIFATRARRASDERYRASLVATSLTWQAVERLQQNFDDAFSVPLSPGQPVGPTLDPTGLFLYGLEQDLVGPPPGNVDDLKRVRVTVTWRSQRGPQQLVVSTKVAR